MCTCTYILYVHNINCWAKNRFIDDTAINRKSIHNILVVIVK